MSRSDRDVLDLLLRNDLLSFIQRCFQTVVPGQQFMPNFHIEAIVYQLERIRRGEIRRLIITLPPRYSKSLCVSVAFPAFLLGHDPTRRIICASYALELAAKHSRDCRAVIQSSWYSNVFPRTRIDPRKNSELEFDTTALGFRFASSVGGTLTGRGGNIIILDDPLKPTDATSAAKRAFLIEWLGSTLLSRLDQKAEDAIILVTQRLHVDDLVGHLLDKGSDWIHLNLPAVAESPMTVQIGPDRYYHRKVGELLHAAREPMSVLEELRAEMGSQAFSAQYQQMPVPPGGALIKRHWFRAYPTLPVRQSGDSIVQSWDTASRANDSNDYSVCTTWLVRGDTYFLLDVIRVRLEYPDLRRRIRTHAEKFRAELVLIEDAGSGMHLIQDLRAWGASVARRYAA